MHRVVERFPVPLFLARIEHAQAICQTDANIVYRRRHVAQRELFGLGVEQPHLGERRTEINDQSLLGLRLELCDALAANRHFVVRFFFHRFRLGDEIFIGGDRNGLVEIPGETLTHEINPLEFIFDGNPIPDIRAARAIHHFDFALADHLVLFVGDGQVRRLKESDLHREFERIGTDDAARIC